MKKHRRVGNVTSLNFFTSQFKLKSTEFPKQSRQRKINTTFSSFKHQMFQQQPKAATRYNSKEGKPVIEQLKFAAQRDDGFKLPQSVSRRSHSKTKEQSRLKVQTKDNQPFENHYQEVIPISQDPQKKPPLYQFAATKRSASNPLKQKLERSALQKFNEAILKENQQNQNVVSQKNAESLYLLLKTARMNQFKHKNTKLFSLPSQSEAEQLQPTDQVEERQETVKRQPYVEKEGGKNIKDNKNMKEVIKSNQYLFHSLQQKDIQAVSQRPPIPKPGPSSPVNEQPSTEVIHFKKVICDQTENQKFSSSGQDSDFGQDLPQANKIQQKPSGKVAEKQGTKTVTDQQNKVFQKETKVQRQKQANQKQKIANQQQRMKAQRQMSKRQAEIKQSRKSIQSDEDVASKKKISAETKKAEPKQKKYEQSDLDNIPTCEAYEKPTANIKQPKNSSDFLEVSNKKIEMVLTSKHLEQPIKTVPKINPPPKLSSNLPAKASLGKPPRQQIEDDELQSIQLGHEKTKKEAQAPKLKKQTSQPVKTEQAKKEKSTAATSTKQVVAAQPITHQQEQEGQQCAIEDELTYYIQRIEDVGQYRINSKDVYSDKSIDKELLQIHKICAYYMAHQFLYLAQWTCNYFKAGNFSNGYYTLAAEELQEMKKSGLLDEEVENISANIQDSKRLLKKCYQQCKSFLKKEEQILIIDGKTNYHIRCCAYIIKEFKRIYDLFQKSPKNTVLIRRCVYLIQMYCALKLLNGEELKEYEDYQDIEKPVDHIETYKKFLLSL